MAQTIQLRRGTAAQWAAASTVLAPGEPGFETDTGILKIGNGATPWAGLPRFASVGALAPVQLRRAAPGGAWVDASGARYDDAARAALRPCPIYWLATPDSLPVVGARAYEANDAFGDQIIVIGA